MPLILGFCDLVENFFALFENQFTVYGDHCLGVSDFFSVNADAALLDKPSCFGFGRGKGTFCQQRQNIDRTVRQLFC